ncbi:M4 family metallopeptidase [Nocardia bovistercoris]|uniref:Neutral metalloproteinase n=1 Tax=Nocardia bovistercoris TaxID=2785916 RepID=A0A931IG26_9NOCA|nr:M4 family metallopeptidase [Nocardia bovistercoris]MBH0780686.1 M4 family metallopeptidase [Nocardia bovistercoris]
MWSHDRHHCITPPHLLEKLLESDDAAVREAALNTLLASSELRGGREGMPSLAGMAASAGGRRTIFDARHEASLSSAVLARSETSEPSQDGSVDRAFDGFGLTRRFYAEVFGRDSIDGFGMRLDGYVHYGRAFNNAFWDGRRMVFGDGDGIIFSDLTGAQDVITHELTHGVTETTAGLVYHKQSGALNESISDVFGSLVKQFSRDETAAEADWLIGAEVFTPRFAGDALRSLKAPGQAYNNPDMGRDRQPAHMKDFVVLPDTPRGDNGGVHLNSGIPNKAFYLTAVGIGGHAWKAPGQIWYEALKASTRTTEFQEFAETTSVKAAQLFGVGSTEQQAVDDAWAQVGIRVASIGASADDLVSASTVSLDTIGETLERLSAEVKALTAAVQESQ